MKTVFSLALALAFTSLSLAQDDMDKKFFDMDNCTICKCMKSMDMSKIKWETHKIDNGMLMLTVVPDDMKPQWATCKKSMEAVVAKVQSGAEVEMCGFCSSFGKLMESGAKEKEVQTAAGIITLVTSDNPAVVRKIHEMSDKITVEHKKMMEMMKQEMMKHQEG